MLGWVKQQGVCPKVICVPQKKECPLAENQRIEYFQCRHQVCLGTVTVSQWRTQRYGMVRRPPHLKFVHKPNTQWSLVAEVMPSSPPSATTCSSCALPPRMLVLAPSGGEGIRLVARRWRRGFGFGRRRWRLLGRLGRHGGRWGRSLGGGQGQQFVGEEGGDFFGGQFRYVTDKQASAPYISGSHEALTECHRQMVHKLCQYLIFWYCWVQKHILWDGWSIMFYWVCIVHVFLFV